jgi:hypothetical protein
LLASIHPDAIWDKAATPECDSPRFSTDSAAFTMGPDIGRLYQRGTAPRRVNDVRALVAAKRWRRGRSSAMSCTASQSAENAYPAGVSVKLQ